jgi:hypothetical protein
MKSEPTTVAMVDAERRRPEPKEQAMTNDLTNAIVAALGDTPLDRKRLHALAVAVDDIRVALANKTLDAADREAAIDAIVGDVILVLRDIREILTARPTVDPLVAAFDEMMANEPGWTPPTGP